MNVGRYMHPDPVTVLADAPLSQAKQVMEENGFGLLLITTAEGALKGFITKGALKEVTDWEVPVEKVCFEARFAVSPNDTLEKAALILLGNQLVLLPVVNDGRLVGVITQSEILRALARALGIGLEGTRLTVKVRHDTDDLFKVFEILQKNDVHIVSMIQGERDEAYCQIILRTQGIADKEGLRTELEAALHKEE
ncbi:CBS domain-containing protein [Candidatus Bipolaricaulota bacterium]|nr:CBS domain-containing protein [Candidatus Bipolaricaulota bacterium]